MADIVIELGLKAAICSGVPPARSDVRPISMKPVKFQIRKRMP